MTAEENSSVQCHGCHKPIPLALSTKPLSSRELELMSGTMEIKCPACGHEGDYADVPLGSVVVMGSD